eukprot:411300-Pelagomonas_calceolata.AAC.3
MAANLSSILMADLDLVKGRQMNYASHGGSLLRKDPTAAPAFFFNILISGPAHFAAGCDLPCIVHNVRGQASARFANHPQLLASQVQHRAAHM